MGKPNGKMTVPAELTRKIRRLDKDCIMFFRRSVEYAWLCGKALIKAKEEIPHGLWSEYVEEALKIPKRTVQRRMYLAQHITEAQIRQIETETDAVALIAESTKNDKFVVFENANDQESQSLTSKEGENYGDTKRISPSERVTDPSERVTDPSERDLDPAEVLAEVCGACDGTGEIEGKKLQDPVTKCEACDGTGLTRQDEVAPGAKPPSEGEPEVRVYDAGVEVKKPPAIRLTKTDRLQMEVEALKDENLKRLRVISEQDAEIQDLKHTLAHIEWENKPGGALGKGSIGDQISSLNAHLRQKDSALADSAREKADLKDEIKKYRRSYKKLKDDNEYLENQVAQLLAEKDMVVVKYKDLMAIITRNDLEHILPEGGAS